MKLKHLALTLPMSLAIVHCSKADSEDVKNEGLRTNIEIEVGQDKKADVKAQLFVGSSAGFGGTMLELTGGDRFDASLDEDQLVLTKTENLFGEITYYGSFSEGNAGDQVVVRLTRESPKKILNSTAIIPNPFSITSPANGFEVSGGESLEIRWDNAEQRDMKYLYQTECTLTSGGLSRIFAAARPIADSGSYQVNVADLINVDGSEKISFCDVEISLKRENEGNLDSNYGEGGYITASQVRTIRIRVTP